jgi:hypothetical protein
MHILVHICILVQNTNLHQNALVTHLMTSFYFYQCLIARAPVTVVTLCETPTWLTFPQLQVGTAKSTINLRKKAILHVTSVHPIKMSQFSTMSSHLELEHVNRASNVLVKCQWAVNFLPVTSQSKVCLVLSFIAPTTCVAAASKLPAVFFASLVVFCTWKKNPGSGVHR